MLLFGLVLLSATTFIGCKKKGCVDANATNYCAKCKDDGTCQYEAKANFWYGKATADSLLADGATALTFYLDGVVIGSSAASVYYTSAPTCGQPVSVTKSLGSLKSKTFSYSIKDQTGYEYWSGNVTLDASNSCSQTQLTW